MKAVIGFGNHLMGDDAIGLCVVEQFTRIYPPGNGIVAVHAARGGGLELLPIIESFTEILFVDCALGVGDPGDWRIFELSELESGRIQIGRSTHEGDPIALMKTSARLGYRPPRCLVFGIQPAAVSGQVGLTARLSSRLDEYVSAIEGRFLN